MNYIVKNNSDIREYIESLGFIQMDGIKPRYTWLVLFSTGDYLCYYPVTTRYANRKGLFEQCTVYDNINDIQKNVNLMNF